MADATAATTPKIEELRARLKADPKSRHFFPLAEELRKFQQFEQAEEILREGLQGHPAYLSAWISLGRVLRDRGREHEAVEVLKRALILDGGNVVAAKLLAQAYLGIGDKIEAIKKFKLVYALMPSDSEVEAEIDRLDREINPQNYPAVEAAAASEPLDPNASKGEAPFGLATELVDESGGVSKGSIVPDASRFDLTDSHPFAFDEEPLVSTSEGALSSLLEPTSAEPFPLAPAAPVDVRPPYEAAASMDAEASPFEAATASEPEPFGEISDVAEFTPPRDVAMREVDEPAHEEEPADSGAAMPATLTMAQLFERQGHQEQATEMYRQILEHEPGNVEAQNALVRSIVAPENVEADSAETIREAKIRRLEMWRARVART